MSLTRKFSALFNKSQSVGKLAIALSQSSIAVCFSSSSSQELRFAKITISANQPIAPNVEKLLTEHDCTGECQLMLSATHYHTVQIDKPDVPDNDLIAALPWLIKDLVPVAPEDMVLDYYISPVQAISANKINVVCTSLANLKPITDTLYEQGLLVKGITTVEFAFANLLGVSEDAKLLLCQQSGEELIILIVKEGKIFFHRQLRGFSQIGTKTREELGFGVIDSLSLEIQRSIDYFERQLKQAPIKQIHVLLPVRDEQSIIDLLGQNTHLPVKSLTLDNTSEEARAMAACYGAYAELNLGVS